MLVIKMYLDFAQNRRISQMCLVKQSIRYNHQI